MAIINKKEMNSMNEDDLKNKLNDIRKQLIKENAQIAVGTTPKSPGLIREMKKTIARIIQILKRKDVQGNEKFLVSQRDTQNPKDFVVPPNKNSEAKENK